MDEDDFRRLGLYDSDAANAADRLALLRYLVEEGCSPEEMVAANRVGRLFALAGDRKVDPGPPTLTLAAAAAAAGLDEDEARQVFNALGLAHLAGGERTLSAADVDVLTTWRVLAGLVGADSALGGYRVLGAAVARVAEAETAVVRSGARELDVGFTGSESATARAYAAAAELTPLIGRLLDVTHRRHLAVVRRHFEQVVDPSGQVVCGVGFADVTGFTALSRTLPLDQLAGLVSGFETVTSEVVGAAGGRVVKHLGDAVMFVAASPTTLAQVAHRLVTDPRGVAAGLRGRAGLAWGRLVAQDGDYFGPPVNLAARLLGVAEPGQVAADPALGEDLRAAGWRLHQLAPRPMRGFDQEVAPLLVAGPPA